MAQECNSTEVLITDLRDELEKGLILHYAGDDSSYTVIKKNEYDKYEYREGLEPPEYFTSFDELVEHLEYIDELEGWEVDIPPPEEEMTFIKTLKACIYFGDEKGAQLVAGQWMLEKLKTRHDIGLSGLSNIVSKLFFEVMERGKKLDTPEWRLEYMHLEMEGEHEKADQLLDAQMNEGISRANQAISELLFKSFEKKWEEELPPLPPGIPNPLEDLLNEFEKRTGETDSCENEDED